MGCKFLVHLSPNIIIIILLVLLWFCLLHYKLYFEQKCWVCQTSPHLFLCVHRLKMWSILILILIMGLLILLWSCIFVVFVHLHNIFLWLLRLIFLFIQEWFKNNIVFCGKNHLLKLVWRYNACEFVPFMLGFSCFSCLWNFYLTLYWT